MYTCVLVPPPLNFEEILKIKGVILVVNRVNSWLIY